MVNETMLKSALRIGIDVGSTTVKLAILDEANDVKFSVYRRHHADVRATIIEVFSEAAADFGNERMTIAITGSGGLLLAQWLGIEFVQEVIASKTAVETFIPETDVAIELGGEDAKIIYFDSESFGHLKDLSCSGIGHCNPAILLWLLNLMDRTLYCLKNPYHDPHFPSFSRFPLNRLLLFTLFSQTGLLSSKIHA